ncbi:hypothetical protein, partial [Xanthobacter versatilis]|uniref:hypothetical protein n=1 Tax=Xanthobacter autotrophicus (strain ATCC BAA-1158 / Py2) TaxID=78245 RepID=UPI00372877BB
DREAFEAAAEEAGFTVTLGGDSWAAPYATLVAARKLWDLAHERARAASPAPQVPVAWREVLNQVLLVDKVAKRGKDGRAFIDARDWEYLLSMTRSALSPAPVASPAPQERHHEARSLDHAIGIQIAAMRVRADQAATGAPPTPQVPDDGTCVRCGSAPRNASGLCATCVDEDAVRAGEVEDGASQALWREALDQERVTAPTAPVPAPPPEPAKAEVVAWERGREDAALSFDRLLYSPRPEGSQTKFFRRRRINPYASHKAAPAAARSAAELDRDIGILIAQIDWLSECTGESLEGEDAALLAQIRADHGERALSLPGEEA